MARLVIEAGRTEGHYWRDLWRYRELFYVLAWRDIMVRYKQTAVGVAWALLQPFLTMIVFTVVFHYLAHMATPEDTPYPLVVLAAMLPWQFFSTSLSGASQSVVANSNLISKVYFPRLIIPAGAVVTALADFLVSFFLLLAVMVWFHFWPTWRMLLLPVLVSIALLAALGPGLLLTALNVRYRDFRYVIPFIMTFGTYVSPVGYVSSVVPEKWRLLYSLNPMVGVIDGFRWAILGGKAEFIYLPGFLLSMGITLLFIGIGVLYFRRTERAFADMI
jgi:lipopolysaccharide transport system permease protein